MSDTATAATPSTPAAPAAATTPPVPVEGAAPAAPSEPAKPPEKKEQLSPQLAALKRQERENQRIAAEVKAEKEALAKERAELEARSKLKSENIDEWLKSEGLTYEQITDLKLKGALAPPPKKEEPPHPEVVKLREQLEAMQKADRERQEAENAREVAAYQDRTFAAVKAAGEKYEIVNAMGAEGLEAVWSVITETARTEGKVLTADEAAAQVEAHFEAQLGEKLKPVLTTKKLSSKLGLASTAPVVDHPKQAVPVAASQQGPSRVVPTLSNSLSAAPAPTGGKPRDLPWGERVANAKRLANGQK